MAAVMRGRAQGRLRARIVLTLVGLGALALLAVAALLVGAQLVDHAALETHDAPTTVSAAAAGEREHVLPVVSALRQQASTRSRSVAIGVLAIVVLVVAAAAGRIGRSRALALRSLCIAGLPPGRGPPRLLA